MLFHQYYLSCKNAIPTWHLNEIRYICFCWNLSSSKWPRKMHENVEWYMQYNHEFSPVLASSIGCGEILTALADSYSPYEDSFLAQQQFGVIHHCAYFVGSLVFKKYHNVYLPTFSLFFSTFTRQPLNHDGKQYQESGHYYSYLLHSEWASSPTKACMLSYIRKVAEWVSPSVIFSQ